MFDVIRFLEDYGIEYWDSGNNVQKGWININCPFCDDPSNHGGFNLDKGYYNCWRCGYHSLEDVIGILSDEGYKKAKEIIFEYSTRKKIIADLKKKESGNKGNIDILNEKIGKYGMNYLSKRGFDPDFLIRKYDLRWGGEVGYWKFRIIIPIYFKGKIVAFQGRDASGLSKKRYITSSSEINLMNPKNILYNIDNSLEDKIGVVEGPTDVWKLGDGFVATLGIDITPSQLKLLGKWKEIFFIFDPETNALKKAKKTIKDLNFLYGSKCEIIDLKEKDPGDLTLSEVESLRKRLGF